MRIVNGGKLAVIAGWCRGKAVCLCWAFERVECLREEALNQDYSDGIQDF